MYIYEFEDFLSDEECSEIIEYRNSLNINQYADLCFWKKKDDDTFLSELCSTLNEKSKKKISYILNSFESLVTPNNIDLEGLGLIKQQVGSYDEIHFDTALIENNCEIKERPFVCLIYLNDSFEGGQLLFPSQKIIISPKKGKIIFFPANYMFPHKVLPFSGEDRFFIRLNFMFKDKMKDKDLDSWDVGRDGIQKFL